MSYLPSSRLYEHDLEAKSAPAAEAPQPAPAAPAPRPVTMAPKEWLVAPAPMFHVEAAKPSPEPPIVETVTTPASSIPPASDEDKPARKRNVFHKAHKVVLRHLDRAKQKATTPGDPDLLWLVVMATGSLCMGLMIWGAYSALPRFGNIRTPLRAEASTTRLKAISDVPVRVVHGETGPIHPQPHVPPLAPPVPAMPVVMPAAPHEPPFTEHRLPETEHPTPAHVELPLAPLPERKDPAIFVHANLGETPMIRTWKKLAETSMLLTAFTMAPAANLLAGVSDKAQIDYSKQIEELTKAVKTLSEQVTAMKIDEKLGAVETKLNEKISKINIPDHDNSTELKILAAKMDKLERLINQLAANNVGGGVGAPGAAGANLDGILTKLDNIVQALAKLQPPEKRIALAPPSPEPALAKTGTSHVILVNLYNQDLWLWVNQKQHRAPANTTLTLDSIPAGPATIEVRSPEGIFYKSNPTLVANETFTLTAR